MDFWKNIIGHFIKKDHSLAHESWLEVVSATALPSLLIIEITINYLGFIQFTGDVVEMRNKLLWNKVLSNLFFRRLFSFLIYKLIILIKWH